MKKFLYLCLFGTALAGGTAWAISAADGVNMAYGRATGVSREQLEAAAKAARNTSSGSAAKAASNVVTKGTYNGVPVTKTVYPAGTKLTSPGNGKYSYTYTVEPGDTVMHIQGEGIDQISITKASGVGGVNRIWNMKTGDMAYQVVDSNGVKMVPSFTDANGNALSGGYFRENLYKPTSGALNQQVKTPQLRSGPQSGFEGEYEFAGYDANGMPVDRYGNILPGDGTDYELPMQNSNVAPKTTPASGANTPTPDAGFDAKAVYGKYNKDMMDHLESQWNGTLPKVLPDSALDMGFIKQAGINEFIPNADGTVDLKMGSDWFGSSLTMDTKDFNAIFGKGGELPIQETHIGGGQSVLSLPNGSVLKEAQNGLLTDGKGNFFLESGGNAYPVDPNMSPAELKTVANQAKAKEALKAALKPSDIDKANVTNAFEYALQILEAVEGINQDDATKETTVKGVQSLQNSQGGASDYSMGTDVSLEATTISSAAELMVELLKNNPMNLTYMDETKCAEYKEDTSTRRECLQEMKKISANATALSGVMIAEGSNAISSKFYDRIKNFTDINNNLGTGSLGAMSVINDAERYPYFEMVRGTALSAVQLGVKEMGTLTELDDLAKEAENAQ